MQVQVAVFIDALGSILTPKRLNYARVVAIAVWAAWLGSVARGSHLVDPFGQVIGADYLEFYAAGQVVRTGESVRLYDVEFMTGVEQQIVGPGLKRYYAFLTPPFLAWLFVPLSCIPYLWSYIAWTSAGLMALWASLALLGLNRRGAAFTWALTFFPVFACVSYGQNSFLSLLILSTSYWCWQKGFAGWSGLAASLLAFKPQLSAGLVLLWLVRWRKDWQDLAGFLLGVAALVCASYWLLPEASRAYLELATTVFGGLPRWLEFPLWNLHTIRGFWWLLLPGHSHVADGLWLVVSALIAVEFVRLCWRFEGNRPVLFAAAIVITVLVTPHALIYDWTLLVIPTTLLWLHAPDRRDDWVPIFAIVWLATYVSGPLTLFQLKHLPAAFQLSVAVLLASAVAAVRILSEPGGHAPDTSVSRRA